MLVMVAGLVLFLGLHSLPVVRPARNALVGAMGDTAYRIVFSLASLGGLILIAEGYKAWVFAGSPVLYTLPAWAAHLSLLLMIPAFVVLFATYGNGHIKRAVKHPMILAVKIWALAHLLANGHAAAVVLFASFLAWGVIERISVKRRERAGELAPPTGTSSWLPDGVAVALGLTVYVLFVWKLHLWLIGVSPVAMG